MDIIMAILIVLFLRVFAFRGTNPAAFLIDLLLVLLILSLLGSCGC
jgi:uncharacterized membrane protein YqaE (UPF0057 family)